MRISKIKKLLELMRDNNLKLFEIEWGKVKYKLELTERGAEKERNYNLQQDAVIENEEIIKAPIAGVIHDVAWAKLVTDEKNRIVKKGELLYTIEIMKSYQETRAEFDMKLLDIFIKEGQIVEYGQPLYRVKGMR